MSGSVCTQNQTRDKTEWRCVPSLLGYRVSACGKVETRWELKSLGRKGNTFVLGTRWRALNLQKLPSKYIYFVVPKSVSPDGKKHTRYVHQAVAEAFIGPCPDGQEVRHEDGNRGNNFATNLLYGTRTENMADCRRHGTLARGSRHGMSKLSESQVAEIWSRLESGEQPKEIAPAYQVTTGAIVQIRKGRNWLHLTRHLA